MYALLSDEYINTIDKVQEPLRSRLTGLIQADKCFSVSYYDDSFNKRRIIVYSYGGQKRAGYSITQKNFGFFGVLLLIFGFYFFTLKW